MAEAFKFVHASDFHLDQSIRGLVELPQHLKSVLANAPYESARKVFDTALSERVDFVLLSGDLFDINNGGPRAAAFMLSQFERLAEKGIEVYWCSGESDPIERWPTSIDLPENVRTFSTSVLEDISHRRNGSVIANIYGIGYDEKRKSAADFITGSEDVFPIALAHGEFDTNSLPIDEVRYWALGGRHRSAKFDKPGCVVAYPGTTQGRHPKESGAYGCYLGRVDTNGKLRVQAIETDCVRWLPQKVAVPESIGETDLKNILTERAMKITSDFREHVILVSWTLAPTGEFNATLRNCSFNERMLQWMRDEFGRGETGIWTTHFIVEPPNQLPMAWYEEDTILGEYLRAIGRYQSDESLNLSLHEYLPDSMEEKELTGIARVSSKRREETLRRAAMIGVDYLAADREVPELAGEVLSD